MPKQKKDQTTKKVTANIGIHDTIPTSDDFQQSFQTLLRDPELMFQFMDLFPFPMEVFAADGMSVFTNKALLALDNVPDASFIDGKYNLINDPVVNDQMGMRACIQKAFRGEAVIAYDVDAPMQDIVDRGVISEKPFVKSSMDWYLYPVMDGRKVAYVVFICIVKNLYHGREDLARAREYMDIHWQGEYDAEAVAKAAGISKSQLYVLFKQHVKITPGEYHKLCKIERVKEKLRDKNLSIKEAFAACGENSRGWLYRVFKETTGLSPGEYRKKYGIS